MLRVQVLGRARQRPGLCRAVRVRCACACAWWRLAVRRPWVARAVAVLRDGPCRAVLWWRDGAPVAVVLCLCALLRQRLEGGPDRHGIQGKRLGLEGAHRRLDGGRLPGAGRGRCRQNATSPAGRFGSAQEMLKAVPRCLAWRRGRRRLRLQRREGRSGAADHKGNERWGLVFREGSLTPVRRTTA